MSEEMFDRLDQFVGSIAKLEGLVKVAPRLVEMIVVGIFGGRAAEKLGGNYSDGALAGMAIDGLAHSNLPNNQIAGLALGIYFTSLGIMNLIPIVDQTFEDRIEEFDRALKSTEERLTRGECVDQGGIPIKVILAIRPDGTVSTVSIPAGFDTNLIPAGVPVVCSFPGTAPAISAGLERRAQRFGETP